MTVISVLLSLAGLAFLTVSLYAFTPADTWEPLYRLTKAIRGRKVGM